MKKKKANVSRHIVKAFFLCFLLASVVLAQEINPIGRSNVVKSIYTDLTSKTCTTIVDQNDANNTPYQTCPGVSGYALILRHVDSGRMSIDVVRSDKKEFPLDYQEVITRSMSHLGDKAEWRVITKNGKSLPIAFITPVQSHEDPDDPGRVTSSYLAVAKITPDTICVTDRILASALSQTRVHQIANAASEKECLESQPSISRE